jgi:hypothetical protein
MPPERQTAPTQAPLTHGQVDTCCRLHRRIRIRTDVIRRLLEPDPARAAPTQGVTIRSGVHM